MYFQTWNRVRRSYFLNHNNGQLIPLYLHTGTKMCKCHKYWIKYEHLILLYLHTVTKMCKCQKYWIKYEQFDFIARKLIVWIKMIIVSLQISDIIF